MTKILTLLVVREIKTTTYKITQILRKSRENRTGQQAERKLHMKFTFKEWALIKHDLEVAEREYVKLMNDSKPSADELSLYYRVVVIKAPLQGLCYTVRDVVDWLICPTARRFQKGSNHSPLQYC